MVWKLENKKMMELNVLKLPIKKEKFPGIEITNVYCFALTKKKK